MTVFQSQKSSLDVAGSHAATAATRSRLSTIEPYAPVWSGQPATMSAGAGSQTPFHPAFERLLKRLPDEHRHALTDEQLHALALASMPPQSRHKIDYRVSIPFFGRRFYLTVLAGREQRSLARLVAEGQLPVTQIARLNPVAWSVMLALVGFAMLTALMIAKVLFGIELTEAVVMPDAMHHLTGAELRPNRLLEN